jgi:hypothetical protein
MSSAVLRASLLRQIAYTKRGIRNTNPIYHKPNLRWLASAAASANNNYQDYQYYQYQNQNHLYYPSALCAAAVASLAVADKLVDCEMELQQPSAESNLVVDGTTKESRLPTTPRNVNLKKMRSLKGRTLEDKYAVDWKTVLGEGAYGSVHPARLRATGEKVALKKISRRYTTTTGFKTETSALLRIYDQGGHPNISGLRDMVR